jgi:formylglycine-generating enzyme
LRGTRSNPPAGFTFRTKCLTVQKMSPNSTVPPEAPTLPLEEISGQEGESQITLSALSAIDVGSVLAGRYRLTELLGEGGMSRVYKAVDLQAPAEPVERAVLAVKVLTRPFADPAGRFAALCAQVNRWRRLSHPNIVRLFDCERDGSIAFITMEYLDGDSTYAKLHRRPAVSPIPLDGAEARLIVRSVAEALDYAHAQDVVHGDLKPGNIVVTRSLEVKVIDFGITRWLARPNASELGAAAAFGATPLYASPQLLSGEEPKPSDDVFGLACLAYELLTGVHPFDGEIGARTVELPPPLRPGLTQVEYAAVVHALQTERDARTPTIREFLAEFSPPAQHPRSARRPLWTAAAVAAAAVAILALYLWPSPKTPPAPAPTASAPAPAPQVSAPVPAPDQPGSVLQDCPTCPAMTVVPAGAFEQGAPQDERDASALEKPQHAVHIGYPFAISTTAVTVDEFRAFALASGRDLEGCDIYDGEWRRRASASWKEPGFAQTARHPAVCVSWNDAVAYAEWLSGNTKHHYRLPSASEWEYAARAGTAQARPWGSDPSGACANANVADRAAEQRYPGWSVFPCDDGYVYTAPAGSFKANAFGLSDMLGNVLVWTKDCWQSDYNGAPSDGSARETGNCRERELRGGSWFSSPKVVKASYRNHFAPDYRTSSVGFRLVRDIDR